MRLRSILPISSAAAMSGTTTSRVAIPILLANSKCVSNSLREPCAIRKCCAYAPALSRSYPSAMLAGMEAPDLLIWLVRPWRSSEGNALVKRYAATAKSMPFCQTIKSLWLLIVDLSCRTLRPSETIAYCLLPIAYCLLPIASLPHSAFPMPPQAGCATGSRRPTTAHAAASGDSACADRQPK